MRRFEALTSRREIDALLRGRAFADTALFRIYLRSTPGTTHRVVIVSPKKIFKRAVDRNRVARRVRALLDLVLPEGEQRYALAVLPKPPLRSAPWEACLHAMTEALHPHA